MDELANLRLFAAAARSGSLAAGGRALGMSRDRASKAIAALERRLGQRLIERTTRGLTLTAAGALYLDRIDGALATLDDAARTLAALDTRPAGRLAIHAPLSWGVTVLAPLCTGFRAAFAAVEIDLTLDDRPVDPASGTADIVIRIAAGVADTASAERLGTATRALYAAPAYLARRGTPASPDDLPAHDGIGYAASGDRDWLLERAGETRRVRPRFALTANVGLVVAAGAVAGEGIAVLPDFLAAPLVESGTLVAVLSGWTGSPLGIRALTAPAFRESPRIARYLDHLRAALAG